MNICKNCGTELKEDAKFCSNCGEKVKERPELEDIVIENPQPQKKISKEKSILAFAFGLAGITFAVNSIYSLLAAIFFFLPGMIVFRCLSKKYYKEYLELGGEENAFLKTARIVNQISLPVGIVFSCFSIVLLFI